MKIDDNGTIREMTPEELAEFEEMRGTDQPSNATTDDVLNALLGVSRYE